MKQDKCRSCGQVISDDNRLTIREKEILFYFLKGYANNRIADINNISVKTVQTHLQSAITVYKVKGVRELMAYCHEKGIVKTIEKQLKEYSDVT